MKTLYSLLFVVINFQLFAQQLEKVQIPEGVVYKYCDPIIYENSLTIVKKELSENPEYLLCGNSFIIGPVLWSRYNKIETLNKIGGALMFFDVGNDQLLGKLTQTLEDSKMVWDELRKELHGKEFKLRKANFIEIKYYWDIIYFDIEEPLIIIETIGHNYILNISPNSMKLIWLDEVPL